MYKGMSAEEMLEEMAKQMGYDHFDESREYTDEEYAKVDKELLEAYDALPLPEDGR